MERPVSLRESVKDSNPTMPDTTTELRPKRTTLRLFAVVALAMVAGLLIVQEGRAYYPEEGGGYTTHVIVDGDGCQPTDLVCINQTSWHLRPRMWLSDSTGPFWREYREGGGRWNVQYCYVEPHPFRALVGLRCSEGLFERGVLIEPGYRCSFNLDRNIRAAVAVVCMRANADPYTYMRPAVEPSWTLFTSIRHCLWVGAVGTWLAGDAVSQLNLPAAETKLATAAASCGAGVFFVP